MITNKYLNTRTQKAFVDGIAGCTEHHFKLLSIIDVTRKKHKSLAICWLDLANAYGTVHHDLIQFSLRHYHAPEQLVSIVSEFYRDLTGIVQTKRWTTAPFPIEVGVFQGDPLSVVIFNTVINTLVDTILQADQYGYAISQSAHRSNLLQYANDTCLVGDGPAACQSLLNMTSRWLDWSGLKAKVPKCASLAIQASSSKPTDSKLYLKNEKIPFIDNEEFKFLGATISLPQQKPTSCL